MKKVVVKTGGETIGIRFNLPERKVYGIDEGDIINLSDMTIEKQKQTDNNIADIMAKDKQQNTIKDIKGVIDDDKRFTE